MARIKLVILFKLFKWVDVGVLQMSYAFGIRLTIIVSTGYYGFASVVRSAASAVASASGYISLSAEHGPGP